ncbi:MAG: hypothetical protein HKN19_00675, partial [Halioglobus sp.]|nr:hypothetical protein [Halioglobus sp.]
IFNIAGPEDCRTTFGAIKQEMAAATGGEPGSNYNWGNNPYPQFYYDTSAAARMFDCVQTSRAELLDNMSLAVGEIGEFLPHWGA